MSVVVTLNGDAKEQFARLVARAEHVVRREELAQRLAEGRKLRVKLGVDPTAKDITLGWAIPLQKLRDFQDSGHRAVLIVGDFTARIGDPSGKSETRRQLSSEEVHRYSDALLDQFMDILSEANLEVRYNSEWLAPLDLTGVLKLTSHYTVAQMLERDDFAKRYSEQRPISILEFMYPLMQAYDSVAVEARINSSTCSSGETFSEPSGNVRRSRSRCRCWSDWTVCKRCLSRSATTSGYERLPARSSERS